MIKGIRRVKQISQNQTKVKREYKRKKERGKLSMQRAALSFESQSPVNFTCNIAQQHKEEL